MQRRAQFYLIDAFFAAAILFVGISLLVSDYVQVPDSQQTQQTSIDATRLLFKTPLADIENPFILTNFAIIDETLTPIQQAHIWVYNATYGGCTDCMDNAGNLTESILVNLLPNQHGVNVTIDVGVDVDIYGRAITRDPDLLVVSKQVVVTPYNDSSIIGPNVAEVSIWR